MGSKASNYHIPRGILWIGRLFLVLLIASGGMTLAGRIAYAGRFSCLQYGAHIIDINRNKGFTLAHAPTLPDPDQRYPLPDGKYIAHFKYSLTSKAYYLTLSDTDGSNERQVIMQKTLNAFLEWSADGQYFATNGPNASGTQKADVWSTAILQPVIHLDTALVVWSPLGHQFATATKGELEVVNPDNKAQRSYSVPLPDSFPYIQWSPDAKYIAITNAVLPLATANEFVHTVVSLDTGQYAQYSSGNYSTFRSLLSLGGYWVHKSGAFVFPQIRQVDGTTRPDLMTLDAATGALSLLVPNVSNIQPSYVSPYSLDASYLAYSFTNNGKWSVETLNVKAGQRVSILANAESLLTNPIVSRDGAWLAVATVTSRNIRGFDSIQIHWARFDGSQHRTIDLATESNAWVTMKWVGDQKWFAYAVDREFGVQFTLVNAETGQRYQVLDQLAPSLFRGGWDAMIAPNGKVAAIGFGDTDSGYESLYIVSLGSALSSKFSRKTINQPITIKQPIVWSPDSAAVAFVSGNNINSSHNLTIISAEGKMLWDKPESNDGLLMWTDCQPFVGSEVKP